MDWTTSPPTNSSHKMEQRSLENFQRASPLLIGNSVIPQSNDSHVKKQILRESENTQSCGNKQVQYKLNEISAFSGSQHVCSDIDVADLQSAITRMNEMENIVCCFCCRCY